MAARAKQRLERMIQDLGAGSDAGGAQSDGERSRDSRASPRGAGGGARRSAVDRGEDAASSVSLGLSDLAAESTEDDLGAPAGARAVTGARRFSQARSASLRGRAARSSSNAAPRMP